MKFAPLFVIVITALFALVPSVAMAADAGPMVIEDPVEAFEKDEPMVIDDPPVISTAGPESPATQGGAAANDSAAPTPLAADNQVTVAAPVGGGTSAAEPIGQLPFTGIAEGILALVAAIGILLVVAGSLIWSSNSSHQRGQLHS